METLFPLEFRSFLDNSKICYTQENNLYVINKGIFTVKLVSVKELNNPDSYNKTISSDIIIHFDRWFTRKEIVQSIILVKAGIYESVYARNCVVIKIDKRSAGLFHSENHLLGLANAKYNYALVRKSDLKVVAVSSFSNSRRLLRGDKNLLSYEWIRFSSLKGIRVIGGMSKILNYFINDVAPEEIMTYCDSDWSNGHSYEKLDFEVITQPQESFYYIDKTTYERLSIKKIRRMYSSLSPDFLNKNFYYLRTKGNYKFLRRFPF